MNMSVQARGRLAFAAALLVVAGAAAGWYGFGGGRFTTYEMRTRDPVSGLLAGAPVEFHGVEVGKVERVELTDPRNVRIVLAVRKDAPVSTATVATVTARGLATRGFTGYVYVALEDGAGPVQPLRRAEADRFPAIAMAPSQSVSLDTSINDLNRSVQSVSTLLTTVLDAQTVASLREAAHNLQQVSGTLAGNNERLASILANAERASTQLQPLLRDSSAAVHYLNAGILPQASQALVRLDGLSGAMDGRLGIILRNTEQASTRFEPLLESGNDAIFSLQTVILPEAERTLHRLDRLSTSLTETADRIERNPALLLRGTAAPKPGPGESP